MKTVPLMLALSACGGWSQRDTLLELAMVPPMASDWAQTNRITTQCREGNFIIGDCGQTVAPNWYFPLAMLVHVGIAAALPAGDIRGAWQMFSLGIQIENVYRNHVDGYSYFP